MVKARPLAKPFYSEFHACFNFLMNITASIQTDHTEQFLHRLAQVALQKVGPALVTAVQANFDQPPADWVALSAATIRAKLRAGFNTPPLVRTGKLRNSITFEVNNLTVRVYSTDPVAAYQDGGTRTIPVRDFFKLSPQAVQQVFVGSHSSKG